VSFEAGMRRSTGGDAGRRRTLTRVLAAAALLLCLFAQGCAGVAVFRMPDEFKGRKLKEDPPISGMVSNPQKNV